MKVKIKKFGLDNINKEVKHELNSAIDEVIELIFSIEENEIIAVQEIYEGRVKSISKSITNLIEEKLTQNHWDKEVRIFISDLKKFQSSRWSIDFVKNKVGLEIAFNHEEGTAWNILKGYISNSNSIESKITHSIGSIIITATNEMKKIGGFDSSIGSFEKYEDYLYVLMQLINYPVILIGLESPDSFMIKHKRLPSRKLAKIEKRG